MSRSALRLGTVVAIFLLLVFGHLIIERSMDSGIRSIFSDDSNQMQRQNDPTPSSNNNNQKDTSFDAGKPPEQQSTSFFKDPCQEIPLPSLKEFFRYLNTVTIICKNKVSFGGVPRSGSMDGDKVVCMDPPYGLSQRNCSVFSFGINNEWSFDDEMDRNDCKVYAFDPTMGRKSHYRSPNIRFFNIGVGGKDGVMKIGKKMAEVMTYKNIVKLTSTENRTIDYLKMDIEGSEIPFFDESLYNSSHLLKRAKQLGVEIHPGRKQTLKNSAPKYWRQFQKLECLGFRLMHMNLNMVGGNPYTENGTVHSNCYELVWMMENPVE